MDNKKKVKETPKQDNARPAFTARGREGQLIDLAMNVAEQRMRDNTASAQEIVHFLRLGSLREQLEREKLESENAMLKAKADVLEAQAKAGSDYQKVIDALKQYSGVADEDISNDIDDIEDGSWGYEFN